MGKPEDLKAFQRRLFAETMKAKQDYRWCSEVNDILEDLGISPQDMIGGEPVEEGMYRFGNEEDSSLRYLRTAFAGTGRRWLELDLNDPRYTINWTEWSSIAMKMLENGTETLVKL